MKSGIKISLRFLQQGTKKRFLTQESYISGTILLNLRRSNIIGQCSNFLTFEKKLLENGHCMKCVWITVEEDNGYRFWFHSSDLKFAIVTFSICA